MNSLHPQRFFLLHHHHLLLLLLLPTTLSLYPNGASSSDGDSIFVPSVVNIDCEQHDQTVWRDRLPPTGESSQLVLDKCQLSEAETWLSFILQKYSNFTSVWLKAVKPSTYPGSGGQSQGAWSSVRTQYCAGISLERLKLTVEQPSQEDVAELAEFLSSLLNCHDVNDLDISRNSERLLPAVLGAPGSKSVLVGLNASWSRVAELEEGMFSGLERLAEVDLSHNKLVKLPNGIFRGIQRLRQLLLHHNSISFISRQSFLGLRHLKRLNLAHNDLASMWIQGPVFGHLGRLRSLDLSYNRLTELDSSGILSDLPSLVTLDLSHNQISRVSGRPFANFTRLQELSLAHNNLASLDQFTLAGLTEALQRLDLEANRLKFVHADAFANLAGLQELRLTGNNLETVPGPVSLLPALTHLNLADNQIDRVEAGWLGGGGGKSEAAGSSLRNIDLSRNQIHTVDEAAFSATPQLETLNLAGNRIGNLSQEVFLAMPHLHTLVLSANHLEDINGVLTSHPALIHLNISHNRLKWFDMAFFPKQLRLLDVQHNEIEELGNYYKLLEGFQLRVLDASYNRISLVGPHTFVDSIEELNLRGNNISDLGSGIFGSLLNLQKVDLTYNAVRSLPQNSLKVSSIKNSSPSFLLHSNPLVCDCELEWLAAYDPASPYFPRILDYSRLTCSLLSSTSPGRSLPISQVGRGEFLCEYSSHCFSLCRCCTFLACDCRMQCPDPCTCLHDQAWNLNIIQCSSKNLTQVLREIPMDSTVVYLDGNHLANLGNEKFLGRNRLAVLYLNSSEVRSVNNRTFLGLWGLRELHLEHNQLEHLGGEVWGESGELEELYLHNNLLATLDNSSLVGLGKLRVLTLHHNLLLSLEAELQVFLPGLQTLTLGKNPWICSCQLSLSFHRLSQQVGQRINHLTCSTDPSSPASDSRMEKQHLHKQQTIVSFHSTCKDLDVLAVSSQSSSSPFLILLVSVLAGVLIIVGVAVSLVLYRDSITRWIYSKAERAKVDHHHHPSQFSPMLKLTPSITQQMTGGGGVSVSSPLSPVTMSHYTPAKSSPPSIEEYSAYLHYCLADDAYVQQVMAPRLEAMDTSSSGNSNKLCLHHRDLPQACSVGQAISSAVASSRCLVILASPSYFLSSIPAYELQMILSSVLTTRFTSSYPVIVGVVPPAKLPEVRSRFQELAGCQADTWTYLEVGDILFYDQVSSLVQKGGRNSSSGGDSSSCSTKSSAASSSTGPAPHAPAPRVMTNPLDNYSHLHNTPPASFQAPPSESIYSTVLDTSGSDEPTYQTVYSDLLLPTTTVYIDRNLELVGSRTMLGGAGLQRDFSPRPPASPSLYIMPGAATSTRTSSRKLELMNRGGSGRNDPVSSTRVTAGSPGSRFKTLM